MTERVYLPTSGVEIEVDTKVKPCIVMRPESGLSLKTWCILIRGHPRNMPLVDSWWTLRHFDNPDDAVLVHNALMFKSGFFLQDAIECDVSTLIYG